MCVADRHDITLAITVALNLNTTNLPSGSLSNLGAYLQTILKNILCLFLQDFVHLNVTQLLIGYTVWFGQSVVVLHSNASKYRKAWRTRLRMFLRMIAEYESWSSFTQLLSHWVCFEDVVDEHQNHTYTRTKKKCRVTYSNSGQDINLTDLHYSRPSNKKNMLHNLCTLHFFFILVYSIVCKHF